MQKANRKRPRHIARCCVLILDEGAPMAVSRIGDDRFLARPKPGAPGPEFVLQAAAATAPAYLHFALWAYAGK